MANLPEADYANLDKLNAAIASDPTFHYLALHANNGDQQSIQALKDLAASKGFPVPDNVACDAGSFQNTGGSIPTWMKVAGIGLAGLGVAGLAAPAFFGVEGGAEAAGAGGAGATAAGAGTGAINATMATGVPAALTGGGATSLGTAGAVGAGGAAGAAGGSAGGAAGAGSGFLSTVGKLAPIISGGFGLAGAALQAHATSDAAKANAQIQQEALDFEKAQLAQKQAALQPYVDTGNQSRGQLAYLLGIGPNNGPNPINTNTPMPAQVQMRDPNGQIESVPASQVAHYQSLGATLVNA
jgi:hypothetical protein